MTSTKHVTTKKNTRATVNTGGVKQAVTKMPMIEMITRIRYVNKSMTDSFLKCPQS